ncbi:MAG: class I mannose-6-phosphate isomerase [Paludibacteraceae bacterium]|nr:class I mannose-6-phosphate isomerase [Paludibacteraceae bacterium]
MLYPLKFRPRHFHKIWGGQRLRPWYNDVPADYDNVGESWVISAVEKYPAEVANGPLAGNELQDLLSIYFDELVGGKVYERFGETFPLLMKFIDADDDLSIQVHPNDEQAADMEQSMGKTEMWYVMPNSEPEAAIIKGWTTEMNPSLIHAAIAGGTLSKHLGHYPVKAGDIVLIESGSVHALKRGTVVAEIQENSDITYRLYDYNRVGNDGRQRPLMVDKAMRVLNFGATTCQIKHEPTQMNESAELAKTPYFTTNLLHFDRELVRDYAPLDSFVAFMCVDGACELEAPEVEEALQKHTLQIGEAILIPASLNDIILRPTTPECKLLEVYL